MTDAPPASGSQALSQAVLDAQRGDEGAFRMLYRAMQPRLLRYLRALVGDDADDVASDTWLHIVRDLGNFHGDWDGFRGWAATIGRHRAMDHLRSARRRASVSTPTDQVYELAANQGTVRGTGLGAVREGVAPDAGTQAEEAVATDMTLALIAALPPDQAEAVLLRVVVGLDARSAGQVLGKRAGAVRTAAYRGLRKLAEVLDPDGPSGLAGFGGLGSLGPAAAPGRRRPADPPGTARTDAVTAEARTALKRVR